MSRNVFFLLFVVIGPGSRVARVKKVHRVRKLSPAGSRITQRIFLSFFLSFYLLFTDMGPGSRAAQRIAESCAGVVKSSPEGFFLRNSRFIR
jgi:hypothetical protein